MRPMFAEFFAEAADALGASLPAGAGGAVLGAGPRL